jgi:hypothetical protein
MDLINELSRVDVGLIFNRSISGKSFVSHWSKVRLNLMGSNHSRHALAHSDLPQCLHFVNSFKMQQLQQTQLSADGRYGRANGHEWKDDLKNRRVSSASANLLSCQLFDYFVDANSLLEKSRFAFIVLYLRVKACITSATRD